MMEYDSENLNSEEIYSSLRGVTEAIQNFSFRSQDDLMELRRDGKRDGMVRRKVGTFSFFSSFPLSPHAFHRPFSPESARPRTLTSWDAVAQPWTTKPRC